MSIRKVLSNVLYYGLLILLCYYLYSCPCPLSSCGKSIYGPGIPNLTSKLRKSTFGSQKSLWQKEDFESISKKGLYEVWFTIINDIEKKESYWIRYTLNIPHKKISRKEGETLEEAIDRLEGSAAIWLMYFNALKPKENFAIKKKFPLSSASGSIPYDDNEGKEAVIVSIGKDSVITLDGLKGSFETTDGRKVLLDLKFSNFVEAYYPIPYIGWMIGLTNTYLSNGHPNLRVSGEIQVGEDFVKTLKDGKGHQTHTYGDSYIEPWTWFHCNTFEGLPDAFLECGYKTRLKKGSCGLFDGEKEWFFNTIFSMKKIKELTKTPTQVLIKIEGSDRDFFLDISVPKESLIGLEYLGPKGNNFYCYNSETSTLRLTMKDKSGNLIDEFVADRSLDFETVWFEPQEGLPYLAHDQGVWKNSDELKNVKKEGRNERIEVKV